MVPSKCAVLSAHTRTPGAGPSLTARAPSFPISLFAATYLIQRLALPWERTTRRKEHP
ncbi:hypothetical protein ACFXAZ_30405 [Streptomyces sp. NPDC059477]|uniref:hypothetical protein n=1 Tax=Streptomyces sp. NPDC059477 TaxID=3346847 RepID=UPI003679C9BD